MVEPQNKGTLKIRPYARLIVMIGDQLIRNEKVALLEIIKNSYDADATTVEINFNGFKIEKDDLKVTPDSFIEVKDNGHGMTFEILKDAWMNPASPNKFLQKRAGKDETKKGRIIQGEKGIGRFAVFKMGKTVEIFTISEKKPEEELYLKSDLSIYDEELLGKKENKSDKQNNSDKHLFIDEIEYHYEISSPKLLSSHGTYIKISNLKDEWSKEKIEGIYADTLKLVSPFNKTDFRCVFKLNGKEIFASDKQNSLDELLGMAPIKAEGNFDAKGNLNIAINGKKRIISFSKLAEIRELKDVFFVPGKFREPQCGPFGFRFYVFDLSRSASLESPLSTEDRELIKSHRVYLYRDGIRVNPYGDPGDDWIELDIKRGTVKAGEYLSNDQITGYVSVTTKENPGLRDKTNREGLMEIGKSYSDLKLLVLGILGILNAEFKKFKIKKEQKEKTRLIKTALVENGFEKLSKQIKKSKDTVAQKIFADLSEDYKKEKKVLAERIEVVEDLAAVGMTVEAASHDLLLMMARAKETLNSLLVLTQKKDISLKEIRETAEKLRGQFAFVEDQLQGIQPLFRSARRGNKNNRIKTIIEKVKLYYSNPISGNKIEFEVQEKGPPLVVNCSEAVLLQLFINLLDNSVYWLTTEDNKEKKIKILLDGTNLSVIFADNGPGISKDDLPFIFEPFFSTKGVKGRGLGLYIARQLLERSDFEIDYIDKKEKTILPGANFKINFVEKSE